MNSRRILATLAVVATVAATAVGTAGTAGAVQTAQPVIVSGTPVAWTPNVLNGKVEAIAQVGNTIVIGGTFTQIQAPTSGAPILTRNRIAAFDATTGAISTTFAPSMSSEVTAIIPAGDGTSVYVGGKFTSAGGVAASKVTRLLVSSGAVVASVSR